MMRPAPSVAAAEVDLLDRPATGAAAAVAGDAAPADAAPGPLAERHVDVVAFGSRRVRLQLVEVEHDPRAPGGFGGDDRVDTAALTSMRRDSSPMRGARQVDREARGVVDRERDRLRRRPVEHEPYLELLAGLRLQFDLGKPGGRLRQARSARRTRVSRPARRAPRADAFDCARSASVRRLFTCDDAAVILGSPCRSFAQRQRGGTLDEAAHAVRNDLDQRDLGFLDGRDAAIALA